MLNDRGRSRYGFQTRFINPDRLTLYINDILYIKIDLTHTNFFFLYLSAINIISLYTSLYILQLSLSAVRALWSFMILRLAATSSHSERGLPSGLCSPLSPRKNGEFMFSPSVFKSTAIFDYRSCSIHVLFVEKFLRLVIFFLLFTSFTGVRHSYIDSPV